MKIFAKWLLLTLLVIVMVGLYFEYCVSRECSMYITVPAGIIAVLVFVAYMVYAVKLLIKLLKLNS
jgi:ABC-type transport system involved in cytochrome c biogenesis permease subunit